MDDRSLIETSPLSNLNDQLRAVEALLFASSDPLDEKTLTEILPKNADIEKILEKIQELYKGRGVELTKVNNKWMFKTASDLSFIMQKEAKVQKKLSKAGLETLSIIAYHQPVSRAEIEEIRGVSVSPGTIDSLLELNWIRIKGRRKAPGNPITYGTTEEFLVHFDLSNIRDLPGLDELKSTGLLDSNLPPDMFPINDDIDPIEENN
ncbi:SMC-Scp complex subunit ScpB [Hyphomicrobiales bacterium]|jgi:segregation and condensation protein B|nr:SMC-Scp complex subunit ScpB [Alphaproteobacteria bacterium]MBT5663671.1 SMC-Scp complex subunit ScpB [Alphaproteobacteria bacterium]MDC0474614.1 SMC-Scp complex subunit ScpB [Hyphomicrobiales bacterium]|tara:strand:- start:74 stop:694 length:621 start_codon:yes stop_codon:yes gene_type:complete